MKSIKVILSNGTTIISTQGDSITVLELATCFQTDRVDYQGNAAYIHLKG